MTQTMDAITKKVLERLAEKPIVDYQQVYGEELRYCWVDEDANRVSPMHKDFGKALSWISNWPELVSRLEAWRQGGGAYAHSEETILRLERNVSITGKPPVQLKRVVTRTFAEPIERYEEPPVRAAMTMAGLSS